jgi:hypothetical protein
VPQDINPKPSVKIALASGETPKVDKPLSPQAERIVPDSSKPPIPKGVPNPAGAESAPTCLPHAASSHDATGTSPRLEPAESPEVPRPSPQSNGLEATGRLRPGEHSSVP